MWQYYAMVAALSLSLAYLAVLFMKWACSRSELVQQWKRRLQGKLPEEKMLLHTLPYYLAITRSSCEVKDYCLDSSLNLQAYVLNLPIGHKISNTAGDAVKLVNYRWKHNKGSWQTLVSLSNCIHS